MSTLCNNCAVEVFWRELESVVLDILLKRPFLNLQIDLLKLPISIYQIGLCDLLMANELLTFHSLNSSRSAYQSISLKMDFFDAYTISGGTQIQCSVLLKAICSVLRTPIASIDHLRVHLPSPDSSKIQWTLNCNNGLEVMLMKTLTYLAAQGRNSGFPI
ncbi:hypothetical protein POM88_016877 [Heracleum sosnowskyi]|uniref:Uncharacterized protein n=1 Tax=Heracleum sosnowskyi TaxID=360622 RepID=A0AAD8MXI0_9APIA|nr:hypothetical protein POM88_016877 [Heracleum sosnowskyi]